MQGTRRAFTLIEILMVMALIGIIAGWAVSRVDLSRFQLDAAVRMIQNVVISAQQTAITRNAQVTLRINRAANTIETRAMVDGSETIRRRALPGGARFLIPTTGIDGNPTDFVGGSGSSEVSGVTFARDVVIAPSGSIRGGDVVVYLGVAVERPGTQRAVEIVGATTRTAFWTYASGTWTRRAY